MLTSHKFQSLLLLAFSGLLHIFNTTMAAEPLVFPKPQRQATEDETNKESEINAPVTTLIVPKPQRQVIEQDKSKKPSKASEFSKPNTMSPTLQSNPTIAEPIIQIPKPQRQNDIQQKEEPSRGIKKKPVENAVPRESTTMPTVVIPGENSSPAVLPEIVPSTKTSGQLSQIPKIDVKKIELAGMTVFSRAELGDYLNKVEGHTVTFEALNQLRHKISELYLSKGYINSGVVIPDQKVEQGYITFKVIEGKLNTVEVEGLDTLDKSYVSSAITNNISNPLNVNELADAVKLLNQDKLIDQINASLVPGNELGQSALKVHVKEAPGFYYAMGVDNYLSPSVGAERATINVGHSNLSGRSDQLDFNLDYTKGLTGSSFSYDTPLPNWRDRIAFYGDYRDYIVVEEPFDQIDIKSTSYYYGLRLSRPFIKHLNEEITASLGFEVKHSESTLLAQPFSFSLGAINGETDVSVLNAGISWVDRLPTSVFSFQGSLRHGLLVFDATENKGNLPDGQFTLFKGQAQYVFLTKLLNSQLLFRSGFQLAFDPLLAFEKFAVGGRYSVRGYRENQFVRDNGITGTLEWRVPLMMDKNERQLLQALTFLDTGSSWDKDENLSKTTKESISSVGIGIQWEPTLNWYAELFYANGFKDLPEPTDTDLQDNGIHFQIRYHSEL